FRDRVFVPVRRRNSTMLLQCPNCGRKGNLPDHLALSTHTVRCRRCDVTFLISPAPERVRAVHAGPSRKSASSAQTARRRSGLARLDSEGLFSGDDDEPIPGSRDPGDSHYDMTGFYDGGIGDSDTEVPAFRSTASSADDEQPSGTFEPASSEVFLTTPWHDRFIDGWSRLQFWVALGFGTFSLAVLTFLLVRAVAGGAVIDLSITGLIVGCLTAVALILLSVSATVLIVVLADLGRSLRRLALESNRDTGIAGD